MNQVRKEKLIFLSTCNRTEKKNENYIINVNVFLLIIISSALNQSKYKNKIHCKISRKKRNKNNKKIKEK